MKEIKHFFPDTKICKIDYKIIESLFYILYKNELISQKEYNLLIAHLNRKLQELMK